MRTALTNFYARWALHLACASLLLLPLKLALAYIALIPSILLALVAHSGSLAQFLGYREKTGFPLVVFVLVAAVLAPFGLHFVNSISAIGHLAFFICFVFFIRDVSSQSNAWKLLLALFAGQSLAALHSVLEGAFPQYFPRLFLGKVTESGQLGMTLVCGIGAVLYLGRIARDKGENLGRSIYCIPFANVPAFILCALSLSFLAFSMHVPAGDLLRWPLIFIAGISLGYCLYRSLTFLRRKFEFASLQYLVMVVIVPLLGAALLINLKRGPWVGSMCAVILLMMIYARRLLNPILAIALCLIVFVEPLRTRLEDSSQDFLVAGGRNVIWDVGRELSIRYPLGIGYANSEVLQKYSAYIPQQMKHFHNNFLNVVAEVGWIGLAIYLWWLGSIFAFSWFGKQAQPERILIFCLGCALFSWQIAGFVEYNFGDSEVFLVAMGILGILAGFERDELKYADLKKGRSVSSSQ